MNTPINTIEEKEFLPMEHAKPLQPSPYYCLHLFVCVNRRNNARSCAGGGAEQLQEYAKRKSRQINLPDPDRTRINKSGCLGRCEHGPVAVVYPDGVWYRYRTQADLDEILSEHIAKGQLVERLLLRDEDEER